MIVLVGRVGGAGVGATVVASVQERGRRPVEVAAIFCLSHIDKLINPYCIQEDAVLTERARQFGQKNWTLVAEGLPNRTAKACCERQDETCYSALVALMDVYACITSHPAAPGVPLPPLQVAVLSEPAFFNQHIQRLGGSCGGEGEQP